MNKPLPITIDSLEKDLGLKFAYPSSTKKYFVGSRPDIQAPYRVIEQTSTTTSTGEVINNPPIHIYDTSGPYSDPDIGIHLEKGLTKPRQP